MSVLQELPGVPIDAAAEIAIATGHENASEEYRYMVFMLWRTRLQTSHPAEFFYASAPFFTDDPGLWEYARRRLDALRAWFAFRC